MSIGVIYLANESDFATQSPEAVSAFIKWVRATEYVKVGSARCNLKTLNVYKTF